MARIAERRSQIEALQLKVEQQQEAIRQLNVDLRQSAANVTRSPSNTREYRIFGNVVYRCQHFLLYSLAVVTVTCSVDAKARQSCAFDGWDADSCVEVGCCYDDSTPGDEAPHCFFQQQISE